MMVIEDARINAPPPAAAGYISVTDAAKNSSLSERYVASLHSMGAW